MNKSLVYLSLLAMGLMLGCGGNGGGGGGGGGGVTVTIAPRSLSLPITLTQQFNATVSGTSNTAVNWAVSGSGCSGAACGAISSTGLYTAPSSIPSSATVSITATSVADSSKSDHVNVTLAHINVMVVPGSATVALNGTQQFNAQISPGASVTGWSVTAASGTTCSGAACGTVGSTGLYTGPSSLPVGNPPKVTITAATADPAPSGTPSATVTLVSSFNSRLSGHYAFHFSGFDALGAVYIAGAFQADGSGNITNGIEDINRASGITTSQAFNGSYALDSNNHGMITLGSSTYKFSIGAGGEAIIVEFDSTGTRGSGVIDAAKSNNFSPGSITGAYVMGLFGTGSAAERVGAAGLFDADGVSAITLLALDINDAGTTTSISATGTYTVSSSNGRGTITVAAPGGPTFHFSFYVVAADELFLVSLDAVSASNPRINGLAVGQATGPFSNASLKGTGVFNLTGLSNTGFNVVALGNLVTDGAGNISSGAMFDANNAGAITAQQALTGTYSMDPSGNGRGTITFTGTAPASGFVLYAVDLNKAFLLDTGSSAAMSGFLEPQSTGSSGVFSAKTLQGTFISGTTSTANTAGADIAGALSFDGVSMFTGSQDDSTPTGNIAAETVAGSYTVSSGGRGTMTLTQPSASNRVIYVVNSSKYYTIGVDATDTKSTVMSAQR